MAPGYVDPGPVPPVVEPHPGRATLIPVSATGAVEITTNIGNTGRTGLTIVGRFGELTTVALDGPAVDALLEALAAHSPVPYVPTLPEVEVLAAPTPEETPAGRRVPLHDHPALEWLAIDLWNTARDGDGSMELWGRLASWLRDRQATGLDAARGGEQR
jgi:hypothetical protein